MMKIALASLLGAEHLSVHRKNVFNELEPYGLLCIGGTAQSLGYDVKIFHPYQNANSTEEQMVRNIIDYQPDILGISSMTNTFNRSVKLAEQVKSNYPYTKVIFGGDHIGTNASDVLNHPVIDVGVYGEGEETFKELLLHYDSGQKNLENVFGIAFSKGDEIVITPPRPRLKDRTNLPLPLRDKEIIQASRIGPLMYPSYSDQTGVVTTMLQFGCPLGCTYCSATTLYGKSLTRTSPERVVSELRNLKETFGVNTAFFTDLTFNLNHKLSENLCSALEKENLGMGWTAMVRPTSPLNQPMLRESTLEAMVAGGCTKIAFGIESLEESAMQDYHRPTSLGEDEKTLRTIDRLGALSKVFLIVGHPNETVAYYDKVIQALKLLKPDEVRISYLTPFPGTELWKSLGDQREELLLTKTYNDYTTFKQVMKMRHVVPEVLEMQRRRILIEYYNSDEYLRHLKYKVKANPRFEKSFSEFHHLLRERRVI